MTGENGPETGPDRENEPEADPTRIRSVAVHREDVANALEATLRSDRTVVLRVTPPYSGRMRARIHRVGAAETDRSGADGPGSDEPGSDDHTEGSDAPIHLDPRDLVETLPAYPEVDDTVAEGPDSDLETRRQQHAEAVEGWRERVRAAVGGTVAIPVPGGRGSGSGGGDDATDGPTGTHEVDVVALGP